MNSNNHDCCTGTSPAPKEERIAPAPSTIFAEKGVNLLKGWEVLNFNRVMAKNMDVFHAFMPLLTKAVAKSILPPSDRQTLVLRTCALTGEVYECTHHLMISKAAGVSAETVQAAKNADPNVLSERELLLCKAAEELITDFCLSNQTFAALQKIYSDAEIIDMTTTVGSYAMMAMYTRSFGIQLEDPDTFKSFAAVRPYK